MQPKPSHSAYGRPLVGQSDAELPGLACIQYGITTPHPGYFLNGTYAGICVVTKRKRSIENMFIYDAGLAKVCLHGETSVQGLHGLEAPLKEG